MARFFLTKVWGFSPETDPALGFSSEGGRNKFLKESKPGDWVIFAGTMTSPTPPQCQGRLMGMVQLGTQEVEVEPLLREIGVEIPKEDYHEDGKYRWPFGLPVIKAKKFVDPPKVIDIFGDNLSGTDWAAYAIDIEQRRGAEVVAKIKTLATEPVMVPEIPAIIRQRERQRALQLRGGEGGTGPGPSTSRAGSERDTGAACAYLLSLVGAPFGSRPVFKIGYAIDVNCRVAELNKGLVTGVTGYSWKLESHQLFTSEKQAFNFEQILHKRLRPHLVDGEREIYRVARRADIDTVWLDVFQVADWAICPDGDLEGEAGDET